MGSSLIAVEVDCTVVAAVASWDPGSAVVVDWAALVASGQTARCSSFVGSVAAGIDRSSGRPFAPGGPDWALVAASAAYFAENLFQISFKIFNSMRSFM